MLHESLDVKVAEPGNKHVSGVIIVKLYTCKFRIDHLLVNGYKCKMVGKVL